MKHPKRVDHTSNEVFLAELLQYQHEQETRIAQLAAMFSDAKWREEMPSWKSCRCVSVSDSIEDESVREPLLTNLAGNLAESELFPLEAVKVRCSGPTEAFVVRTG